MKTIAASAAVAILLATGCTSRSPGPDEVRERTAQATADLKRNAQALAQGVKEGWSRDQPLDLNHASKDQLASLPGMSNEGAERIIDARPYRNSSELVTRHVISQPEFDKIKDEVTAR
jgi:DNA uptake protein ComE-like DNA-binding protein